MIKDTFFSFSSFGKLCRKEILENWKLDVLQLLVMYLIMAIILIWYSYTDYSSFNILTKTNDLNVHIFTLVFWMWSWWAFMCLGTSFAFKTMKCKTGRITMLMIPATVFEKFFFRWLVYVLILPLLIFLSIQSLFLLGSIVWPKNSFIKTLISIVLVAFLYNWGVVAFTRFSENSTLSTLILFFFKWGYILFPILTIINWTLTYFRLKESEVIHRI